MERSFLAQLSPDDVEKIWAWSVAEGALEGEVEGVNDLMERHADRNCP